MTYAKPEQPVLRTPSRSPVPCPRAARKLLTRSAADSVSEILMVPHILRHPVKSRAPLPARAYRIARHAISRGPAASTPVREAGAQGIFDHQQPAEFLCRDTVCLRPPAWCAWNQLLTRPSAQLPAEPGGHLRSMRAGERLKACLLHSVAGDEEVKAHPGLLPASSRLAAHDGGCGHRGAHRAMERRIERPGTGRECAQPRE